MPDNAIFAIAARFFFTPIPPNGKMVPQLPKVSLFREGLFTPPQRFFCIGKI
jgi:hypothetical protein